MKNVRSGLARLLIATVTLVVAAASNAGFGTTVPVSAELATNIARSLFPVSLKAGSGNLFLTSPVVVFLDDKRIGLQVHLQAYEHRPEQGIAVSEEGQALLSGELGYDPVTRQILLFRPLIDSLVFDRDSDITRRLRAEIRGAWAAQVTNPMRADVPPHPYIQPFRPGIQDVTYENRSILIQVWYP